MKKLLNRKREKIKNFCLEDNPQKNIFPNKKVKNWAVYDFETEGRKVTYWAILTNSGIFKYGWLGKKQFLNCLKELCQKKKTWYLFAHYGIKYDCSFLLKDFANESRVRRNEYRTTNIKWKNIHFLDSYLLFGEKLENLPLTKEEEIIKKKGRQKIEKDGLNSMNKEEIKEYCDNDVRALFRIINEFFNDFFEEGGEKLIGKVSIGSIAVNQWKKNNPQQFKKLPNLARRIYSNIYDFIQPSLIGGFVGMANQAIWDYLSYKNDYNSIYPDMMVKMPLPVGLPIKHLTFEKHCEPCWNKQMKGYYRPHEIPKIDKNNIPFGFIRVEINNLEAQGDARKIPFVPVKHNEYEESKNKEIKISYCPLKIKRLEGVYFSEFLKLILKYYTYSSIKYREAYIFRSEKGFFKDWVGKYQKLKTEAKEKLEEIKKGNLSSEEKPKWKQQYYFAKLMQLCVFGKMGQKKTHREYLWKEGKSPNIGISPTYRKDGKDYHLILSEEREGFGFNYVPIAAAITAYGRIKLIETIFAIGVDNVLYWDTDSIVSKIKFPEELTHPWEMGKWKLEAVYKKFITFAAKAYYGETQDDSVHWTYKGYGRQPFIEYKVDPVKLLLKGLKTSDKIMSRDSMRKSWGIEFFEKPIELKSAYENKKMDFIKGSDSDYLWQPPPEAEWIGIIKENGKIIAFSDNFEDRMI